MMSAIDDLGCKTGPLEELVECVSASQQEKGMVGGFAAHTGGSGPYKPRIVLVEEHNYSQEVFDRTLTHELVHAYDQCRANVDWKDLRHVACSEIRASQLSGECEFKQEVDRGSFGFMKQHQKCIRRRAALSVGLAHNGTSKEVAEKAVDSVYDQCYKDLAPFRKDYFDLPYYEGFK